MHKLLMRLAPGLRNWSAPGLQERRLPPSGKARRESGTFSALHAEPTVFAQDQANFQGVKIQAYPNEPDEKVPKLHFPTLKFRSSGS